jgi:hypothetical protein
MVSRPHRDFLFEPKNLIFFQLNKSGQLLLIIKNRTEFPSSAVSRKMADHTGTCNQITYHLVLFIPNRNLVALPWTIAGFDRWDQEARQSTSVMLVDLGK